jgi:hypothetical protein
LRPLNPARIVHGHAGSDNQELPRNLAGLTLYCVEVIAGIWASPTQLPNKTKPWAVSDLDATRSRVVRLSASTIRVRP